MSRDHIHRFRLVSEAEECRFLEDLKRTCYLSVYPYKLFPHLELYELELEPLTILYGGNGSGKTTLLNLIAEKAGIQRHARFNSSAFFQQYVRSCELEGRAPHGSQILTSDDVFDGLLDLRCLNDGLDLRREDLLQEFTQRKYASCQLHSLDELEDFRDSCDAKSKSQSQFVRERMMQNMPMHSNGETAMKYFTDHITENAVFLLDEPENSLSIDLQEALATYLFDSVRHFGCQIIMATHSPVMLALQEARIYDLDTVPVVPRHWTELENVRRYYDFFKAHQAEFENIPVHG